MAPSSAMLPPPSIDDGTEGGSVMTPHLKGMTGIVEGQQQFTLGSSFFCLLGLDGREELVPKDASRGTWSVAHHAGPAAIMRFLFSVEDHVEGLLTGILGPGFQQLVLVGFHGLPVYKLGKFVNEIDAPASTLCQHDVDSTIAYPMAANVAKYFIIRRLSFFSFSVKSLAGLRGSPKTYSISSPCSIMSCNKKKRCDQLNFTRLL